jgi:hypothetical protein
MSPVRGALRELLIACLLTVAAAACIAEATGRWDVTIHDANDEAGLVAVVLCVGAAVATASVTRELLHAIGATSPSRVAAGLELTAVLRVGNAVIPHAPGPPLIPLKI